MMQKQKPGGLFPKKLRSYRSKYVGLTSRQTGHTTYFDWVFVRKYTPPEPATSLRQERTPQNSPTVYTVVMDYHKPKLLIREVIFPQSGEHMVVLYNNDTKFLEYTNLVLNNSKNAHKIESIALAPKESANISLGYNFFQNPGSSGDFLFLNDSTYGMSEVAPNGIIDFVNWTDINGNPPPSEGNITIKYKEWNDGPVNLSISQSFPERINRTEYGGVPNDNDIKDDWYVEELDAIPLVLIAYPILFLYLRCSRQTRKPKRRYIASAGVLYESVPR